MSNEPIHLLVPMSGQGTRYQRAGYAEPKPLIPISNIPMVERLLSCFPLSWPAYFVMAENHRMSKLPYLLKKLRPYASQEFIPPHKFGPSYALRTTLQNIPSDAPVFVSYCDYGMIWDASHFEKFVRQSQCDACLVSYRGFHAHYLSPVMYAYSRLEGERVVEVREKGAFTDNREAEFASCGGYYFRSAQVLKEAIAFQIEHQLQVNGEYYTSLSVQALLMMKKNAHVRVFEIPAFFQWGTPDDLRDFEYWEKTYSAFNRYVGKRGNVAQVLMPMAGAGSRFSDLSSKPKPLISVADKPMFVQALDSMPTPQKVVCVALSSFADSVSKENQYPNTAVVVLQSTPPGQALSTEAGCEKLLRDQAVIVTSCDHGIVLSPDLWETFQNNPRCDAAIFTIKNFPGSRRKSKSYAYVIPCDVQDAFPLVSRVSVKEVVSENPFNDNVLVGTFWFKSSEILIKGIQELKKRNILINNELYLDSVFTCLADMGYIVRMIPLDGYICWGDPDALAESLYWQEIYCAHRVDFRKKIPGVL